jgi:hypothetical protein
LREKNFLASISRLHLARLFLVGLLYDLLLEFDTFLEFWLWGLVSRVKMPLFWKKKKSMAVVSSPPVTRKMTTPGVSRNQGGVTVRGSYRKISASRLPSKDIDPEVLVVNDLCNHSYHWNEVLI